MPNCRQNTRLPLKSRNGIAVAVPELVSQASGAALVALWQQAQELANESLRAAQAAWETERAELDGMRQELADA